ncbi:MAG: selenide, water dikinase SelD, partial [Gammaproteobacteria bacterium]
MSTADRKTSDLVLAGGGHAHVQVLRSLAAKPLPGVRATVISRDIQIPYSGMLPGYVAGHYEWSDLHIDLAPLAAAAGARLVAGRIESVDLEARAVIAADRPPQRFDLLSINTGATPSLDQIVDANRFGISVKPISRFLPQWHELLERLRGLGTRRFRLAIVGSGAGGVELALAIRHRLAVVEKIDNVEILVISSADRLLLGHNGGVRDRMRKLLSDRGLDVHLSARVTAAREGALETDVDGSIAVDEVLWVTHAGPPAWPAAAGLEVTDGGFVLVNTALRSVSHPDVFAAGDVATVEHFPRPKAGVFAVRHGQVLVANLRRASAGKELKTFKPQIAVLSLISTGGKYAIASRGDFAAQGKWVWHWKDLIDRRFMARFAVDREPETSGVRLVMTSPATRVAERRCGGAAARLPDDVLARVLSRIGSGKKNDDGAVLRPVANALEIQSIDGFRAMVEDPHAVGRIAAEHALNDVYAMGGLPRTALAWVTVAHAAEPLMEEDLYQAMSGARRAFDESGTMLVGGHSGEGAELSVGFAVSGTVDDGEAWNKNRLSLDDALILTKPIGTGVLLAANMRAMCRGDWLLGALDSMQRSNKHAVRIFRESGVRACTDVAGCGLLGHAVEMSRAARLCIELYANRVKLLPGTDELIASGIASSLHAANERVLGEIDTGVFDDARLRALLDPQTSGGLLAAV